METHDYLFFIIFPINFHLWGGLNGDLSFGRPKASVVTGPQISGYGPELRCIIQGLILSGEFFVLPRTDRLTDGPNNG